jgi:hypothetical protein
MKVYAENSNAEVAPVVEYLIQTYRPLLEQAANGKTTVGPELVAPIVGINRDELRARCIARPESVEFDYTIVGKRVKFSILPLVMRMSCASAENIFDAIAQIRKGA